VRTELSRASFRYARRETEPHRPRLRDHGRRAIPQGERALTSFDDERPTTAAIDAAADNLGTVDDPETRERYAAEASRLADEHASDDHV
jgi:hypothetical protein